MIWGGQKVTQHGFFFFFFFQIRMQNGTRKFVAEVLSSHVVLLGHSSKQPNNYLIIVPLQIFLLGLLDFMKSGDWQLLYEFYIVISLVVEYTTTVQ